MYNDLQTGSIDNDNINIHEYFEIEHWTKELNVSVEVLKDAVDHVGTAIQDIRKYLHKN
jgi:hypothetical protein